MMEDAVGSGMNPLTTMAPPEATEMRCPSLRVTAEPGTTVWEPIMMAELESIEIVWDPRRMGDAGAVVGGAFVGKLESSFVEGTLPGCPVSVPVSVAPPWPVLVPVLVGPP
jgi:hypothetical protein